ncbi:MULTISPECIES: hypothetical protein [unclassified Halomonas]|uniref:hypothetical protein n=1 Tax=unclassified Halomonas TaxID=2609666 RepID=UPI001CF3D841|nr:MULTISPECIES: hypothetical protein [unclassified Halomonas]MCA8865291.1 hypothetical protein [Halomonas sp. SBBP1]UZH12250.1 hypothetical protein OM794_11170 [Halomonas sp. BDJS001]
MDKAAYHKRWDQLEQMQREYSNLPESGVENIVALHKMLINTFREFVIACYCDHWRDAYRGAALPLDADRDVLIVRAIKAHHWTLGIASSLTNYDLSLSLVDELATFKMTEMAVHVSYMNLQALPKGEYQSLIQPHE